VITEGQEEFEDNKGSLKITKGKYNPYIEGQEEFEDNKGVSIIRTSKDRKSLKITKG
jgi:hypothetical protein